MKKAFAFSVFFVFFMILAGCGNPLAPVATYTVTYSGNGNTGGAVPVDPTPYPYNYTITVLGNTGNLVKTGFAFRGWSTSSDGYGSPIPPGAAYPMPAHDLVFYARWIATGSTDTVIESTPKESRLYTRPASSGGTLVSMGLGPELPINGWTTWRVDSSDYIWLSFSALAGKTYTVYWDDLYDGSMAPDSAKFYNADIEVGAFLSDGVTRVDGWAADSDSGYSTGVSVSVPYAQKVKLRIRPWHGGSATGGFGIRIQGDDALTSTTAFSWYLDGILQDSITTNSVLLSPSSLSSGTHRLVGVATRRGVSFSEEYSFSK